MLTRAATPQVGGPPPTVSLGPVQALGATRFMAFGDSITCGVISSFNDPMLFVPSNCNEPVFSYPRQLRGVLTNSFPTQAFTVANEGSPGEWALNALNTGRFLQAVGSQRPQGLILLEGINDLNNGRSISGTVDALRQMIDIAGLYNTTVLVSTMFQTCVASFPDGSIRQNSSDKITAFNSAIVNMAAGRQNVYVVDLYGAFGTGNCDASGGINLLGHDGLHPTSSGYARMATTFTSALTNVFAVRGSYQ
ncbi:MAG: SGNH/GDSL hydrolase family protein [Vicinamibacterales bacterium]